MDDRHIVNEHASVMCDAPVTAPGFPACVIFPLVVVCRSASLDHWRSNGLRAVGVAITQSDSHSLRVENAAMKMQRYRPLPTVAHLAIDVLRRARRMLVQEVLNGGGTSG